MRAHEHTVSPSFLTGLFFPVATALLLSINNTAQAVFYDAGGTIQTMLFLRFFLYVVACVIIFPFIGERLKLSRTDLKGGMVSGLSFALATLMLLTAFQYIPVSLAILVLFLFPILTALLASIVARRAPRVIQIVLLVVAFSGLAMALEVHSIKHDMRGVTLAGIGAVLMAITFVWNERVATHVGSTVKTYHMSLTGMVLMALVLPYWGSMPVPLPGETPFLPMVIALAGYLFAFLTMFKSVERIGATPSAMIMNLEPVFTLAFTIAILSEKVTAARIVGSAIVLAAVVVSQWASRREAAPRIGAPPPAEH